MSRPKLEVADIFRDHGAAWRSANAGHVSLDQLKVMSAIERCRTAALGGHVERCEKCSHTIIAYNSCRNRHCPKCQGAAAREWLAEREAELLPVPYYHVVFTLPARITDIAYQNKAVIYDLLFKASSETMLTIAADPKHLGARIGILSVLHTWGSAMTHHPHVHMIVPGGGFSLDGKCWVSCRPRFFLSVDVLSALFRGCSWTSSRAAYQAGELQFFGKHARLIDPQAFAAYLTPLRTQTGWSTASAHSAAPRRCCAISPATPTGSPSQIDAWSHATRKASPSSGRTTGSKVATRYQMMTLATDEFIRRFLMHVLPAGFHRIRYYGLLASGKRADNIARARELLTLPMIPVDAIKAANTNADQPQTPEHRCPCCGGRMIIIERFERGATPRYHPSPPTPAFRIDTS